MQQTSENFSQNQALKDFANSSDKSAVNLKVQGDSGLNNVAGLVISSSSFEHNSKLEDIMSKYKTESDIRIPQTRRIKKSQSLGSNLDQKGRVCDDDDDTEDATDQEFSCDGSHAHVGLVVPLGGNDPGIDLPDQYEASLPSNSLQLSSGMVNNESIFSIGDPQQSEKGDHENSDAQLHAEFAGESSNFAPCSLPVIVKSSSFANIGSGGYFNSAYFVPCSRSSEELNVVDSRSKDLSVHEVKTQVTLDQQRDDSMLNGEKNNYENPVDDSYDSYNYVGSAKDWIIPVTDQVNLMKNIQEESSVCRWKKLSRTDFKLKRIEEWVTDLQQCSPFEETNEYSTSNDHQRLGDDTVLDSLTAARLDGKANPGMEAANKYVSSLSATATTAQLADHGLVAIPSLSAFVSLKALNLSGNAIVKITAGALPRGLHILNLSKNNISTIEGLRELARLRVLVLSYNRILRIGHGLASCSSLKELYLAGNKISEVEGLHRLLKLNILDLRFNKISTAKGLGQLAANYNSLQAISLEGNPAQKNVGDEQLKKHLQSLLPHLVYFNRQTIKAGTLKDTADRSARLGVSVHQIDRGLIHKTVRKGSHGVAGHKVTSSSIHGRKSQAVATAKLSMGRHGRLPPSGIKIASPRHHFYDFGSKLHNFRTDLSIHRSRSEGTLGGL